MEEWSLWFLVVLLPVMGFLLERFALYKIRRLAEKSPWAWDDALVYSLRFMPTLWFSLLALHIALDKLPLALKVLQIKDKVVWVLAILSVAFFLSRLVGEFLNLYMKRYREDVPATSLVVQITKVFVFLLGLLVALDKLGVSITPVITALGIGGLAVGLALKDTLENLFAGFHILASRQIKPGDFIRLENGLEGFVEDITWRNTIIRQTTNNLIIVPNSKLATSVVVNFHMPEPELAVVVPVGVSYDSDLEKVERTTLEVARQVQREVEGAVPDFEPILRYYQFGDFSINFNVVLRAKDSTSQHVVRHEFIKRLHRRYMEEGIKIPYPVREVIIAEVSHGLKEARGGKLQSDKGEGRA